MRKKRTDFAFLPLDAHDSTNATTTSRAAPTTIKATGLVEFFVTKAARVTLVASPSDP
jgi:hypothetical protein